MPIRAIGSRDVLHRPHDVLMSDLTDGLIFAFEARDRFRLLREQRGQHFDGDKLVEVLVPGLVHSPHAPLAEFLKKLMRPEFRVESHPG